MKIYKLFLFFIFILHFKIIHASNYSEVPFQVYIKPQSKLSDLNFTEFVKTTKGIYANVIEKDHVARSEFWVLDKKGEKRYIVSSKDIVELKNDTDILPTELGNTTYPAKSLNFSYDHRINFESEFSLHFDNLNLSPLQNITNDQVQTIQAPRYQFSTNYIATIPVNIGLGISLQEAAWKNQDLLTNQLTIFTFGPNIKYRISDSDFYSVAAQFTFEYALNYQTATNSSKNTFSAYIWSLGLVNDFQTPLGIIQIGVDYRKHYVQLSNINNPSVTDEFNISSTGAFLGYKIGWNL